MITVHLVLGSSSTTEPVLDSRAAAQASDDIDIIRDLNYNPALRKVAAQKLVRDVVGADGGPLMYKRVGRGVTLPRFDHSTCRKLYRFLNPSINLSVKPQITHESLGRGERGRI